MSDAPPRLFFALVPDEAGLRFLESQQAQLKRYGWERYARFAPPESLHLTLRFLGPVSERVLPDLLTAAGEAARTAAGFEYEAGKAMLFPRVSRAKIVAAGITPNFRLKNLARALDRAAIQVGLPASEFPFRAHITLARLKSSASRPNLPSLGGRLTIPAGKVVLFASDLKAEGTVYRELASYPIGF